MFSALLLLLTACGSGPGDANPAAGGATTKAAATGGAPAATSALEVQVLARHDSLMIGTGHLYGLRRRLTAGRAVVAGRAPRLVARLDSAIGATLRADDAMTDWMHAYRAPAAGTAPDSSAAYFQRQLRALDAVDARLRGAFDSATAVLRALPAAAAASSSR